VRAAGAGETGRAAAAAALSAAGRPGRQPPVFPRRCLLVASVFYLSWPACTRPSPPPPPPAGVDTLYSCCVGNCATCEVQLVPPAGAAARHAFWVRACVTAVPRHAAEVMFDLLGDGLPGWYLRTAVRGEQGGMEARGAWSDLGRCAAGGAQATGWVGNTAVRAPLLPPVAMAEGWRRDDTAGVGRSPVGRGDTALVRPAMCTHAAMPDHPRWRSAHVSRP